MRNVTHALVAAAAAVLIVLATRLLSLALRAARRSPRAA